MEEIVNRLHENRQIELAKEILESNGYKVIKESKRISESSIEKSTYDKVNHVHPEYGISNWESVGDKVSELLGEPAKDIGIITGSYPLNTDTSLKSITVSKMLTKQGAKILDKVPATGGMSYTLKSTKSGVHYVEAKNTSGGRVYICTTDHSLLEYIEDMIKNSERYLNDTNNIENGTY